VTQEWNLVRVWDAMEFEDEHSESNSVGVAGRGDFDLGQSKDILHLDFPTTILFWGLVALTKH
jgi:hypothetical protein